MHLEHLTLDQMRDRAIAAVSKISDEDDRRRFDAALEVFWYDHASLADIFEDATELRKEG